MSAIDTPTNSTSTVESPTIGNWEQVPLTQQPGHDLMCISRPVVFDTEAIARAAKVGSARAEVDQQDALETARELYASLGIRDERLAMDAANLIQAYKQNIQDGPVNLRIDVCDTTTCPKFHHDHRYIRLVTTYSGPTTQYISSQQGKDAIDAKPWELLLFKGAAHPTFSETVKHRSPPMSKGERRLCLVIDC